MKNLDPFVGTDGKPRSLRGVTIGSGSTRLAELAIICGFDVAWIDLEHGPTTLEQAEMMCMAMESVGGIPLIRVPSHERPHVLGALEVGARIVLVPMVNVVDQARQIVRHGKFPPLGQRGLNSRTRGNRYAAYDSTAELMQAGNQRTHLFAQIETEQASANVVEICGVEGLSGIFVGPSDLSVDMGIPGELADPKLIAVAKTCIQHARRAGKHAGTLASPGSRLFEAAIEAGADLMITGGDVADLAQAWKTLAAKAD